MEKPIIIRKAKTNLYIILALSILTFIFFIYIADFSRGRLVASLLLAGIPIAISSVPLFVYAVRELVRKTPQLILTEEGLETKNKKSYAWSNIQALSFGTEKVGSDNAGEIHKNYLTLELLDGSQVKLPVSHLDRNANEIIYLIRQFKSAADAKVDQQKSI